MTSDEIIDKVKKILLKTEGAGCTPEEAAAALAKAQSLLIEHNLTMSDIHTSGGVGEMDDHFVGSWKRWNNDLGLAAGICVGFFFVKGIKRNHTGDDGVRYTTQIFFGDHANVETARWAFHAIVGAFSRLWSEYRIRNPHVPRTDRRMFILGVSRGFCDKLRMERMADEMEADIVSGCASGGAALALVRIETVVAKKFDEAHPGLKNNKPMKYGNGSRSSLDAGYEEGRRLELHREIEAEKPKKQKQQKQLG
jgi:hypothetical protein